MNVLLMNNNSDKFRILKDILYKYDFKFFEFSSVSEAFEIFVSNRIDLFVTDILLEDNIDGVELARWFCVPTILVFSSSYTQYMYDSLDIENIYFTTSSYDIEALDTFINSIDINTIISDDILICNNYTYDKNSKNIFYQKRQIQVTSRESILLFLLVTKKNRILLHDIISKVLFDNKSNTSSQRALVYRLRSKLPDISIDTVRPFGLRLNSME